MDTNINDSILIKKVNGKLDLICKNKKNQIERIIKEENKLEKIKTNNN